MLKKLAFASALALGLGAHGSLAQSANPVVSYVQTATTSAVALPATSLSSGVVLKADAGNSGVIYIGPCSSLTTATGYPLKAGEAISYGITNLASICMVGAVTTDILHATGN
jgi:hypothetical protein